MKFVLSSKALVSINLILGLLLWFMFFTDYSLTGTISDILFPLLAGAIAVVSLTLIKTSNKRQRFLITLAHLPSIIGSGSYILTGLIIFYPPLTLGTLFTISEIASETEIQRATAPDGTRTAYVYFRGVGAYTGGNGRIFVRVRHRFLPILERDIFYLKSLEETGDPTDYLAWKDNNTIYISETKQEIAVGIIEPELPPIIAIPYNIYRSIQAISLVTNQSKSKAITQ